MMLPPLGLCLPCRVTRVRDGDTLEVTVLTGATWAIRLIDCWCPELHRGTEEERARGLAAAEYTRQTVDEAEQCWVYVPAPEHVRDLATRGGVNLLKGVTFDRVPAYLFVRHDTTLNELLVRAGHATHNKAK